MNERESKVKNEFSEFYAKHFIAPAIYLFKSKGKMVLLLSKTIAKRNNFLTTSKDEFKEILCKSIGLILYHKNMK